MRPTRRTLLAATTGAVAGLAGCSGSGNGKGAGGGDNDDGSDGDGGGSGGETTAVTPPDVDIAFEVKADGDRIAVVHDGGDDIDESNAGAPGDCGAPGLLVRIRDRDGSRRSECWTDTPITDGDRYVVDDVAPEDGVVVFWEAPDGSDTQILAEYEGG